MKPSAISIALRVLLIPNIPNSSGYPCYHLLIANKRFALKLQDRELDIRYRPGKTNGNADGLSRQDWDEDELDFESEVVLGYQTSPTGEVLAGGDVGPPSCERKK